MDLASLRRSNANASANPNPNPNPNSAPKPTSLETEDEEEYYDSEEEREERLLSRRHGEAQDDSAGRTTTTTTTATATSTNKSKRKKTAQEIAAEYNNPSSGALKAKRRRKKIAVTEELLIEPHGLSNLFYNFPRKSFGRKNPQTQKPHYARNPSDMAHYSKSLVQAYRNWADRLAPGVPLEESLFRLRTMHTKSTVKAHLETLHAQVRNRNLERVYGKDKAAELLQQLEEGLLQEEDLDAPTGTAYDDQQQDDLEAQEQEQALLQAQQDQLEAALQEPTTTTNTDEVEPTTTTTMTAVAPAAVTPLTKTTTLHEPTQEDEEERPPNAVRAQQLLARQHLLQDRQKRLRAKDDDDSDEEEFTFVADASTTTPTIDSDDDKPPSTSRHKKAKKRVIDDSEDEDDEQASLGTSTQKEDLEDSTMEEEQAKPLDGCNKEDVMEEEQTKQFDGDNDSTDGEPVAEEEKKDLEEDEEDDSSQENKVTLATSRDVEIDSEQVPTTETPPESLSPADAADGATPPLTQPSTMTTQEVVDMDEAPVGFQTQPLEGDDKDSTITPDDEEPVVEEENASEEQGSPEDETHLPALPEVCQVLPVTQKTPPESLSPATSPADAADGPTPPLTQPSTVATQEVIGMDVDPVGSQNQSLLVATQASEAPTVMASPMTGSWKQATEEAAPMEESNSS